MTKAHEHSVNFLTDRASYFENIGELGSQMEVGSMVSSVVAITVLPVLLGIPYGSVFSLHLTC